MADVRAIAAAYGVRVELADLGDWGTATLIAEYDPDGPVIRLNERELKAPSRIDVAIAHELYHHLEAIGEIPPIAERAAREAAADAFAEHVTGMADALPDAVVRTAAVPGRGGR